MAHWAEIDENNIVLRVVVGSNDEPDEGYQWLIDNLGGIWIKTSYNTFGGVHAFGGEPLRKNYAGIGMTYDPVRDAFIPPKPKEEEGNWIFNEDTCQYELDETIQQLAEVPATIESTQPDEADLTEGQN
jgi:hypothetical protein